jgi:hypothetical protein
METIAREAVISTMRAHAIRSREEAERNTGEHCVFRCSMSEACLASRRGMDEDEFLQGAGFIRRRD